MQTYFVQDMLADQDRELHVFFLFLNKNVCAKCNESNCSVLWGKYLQIRIIINIIAEDMTCRLRILSKRWHPFRSVPLTYN